MFTKLEHGIYPIKEFLVKYEDMFQEAARNIDKRFPHYDVNYLIEYKDHPANIYQKFNKPDCYASIVIDGSRIIAFSITYGYDNETCILGARSFTGRNTGYEARGILSAYCLPMQMQIQRGKYKFGMSSFNINSYSDRLWVAYRRTFEKNWWKHKQTVNTIFPDYDYPKIKCMDETKIINGVEQHYSIVEL